MTLMIFDMGNKLEVVEEIHKDEVLRILGIDNQTLLKNWRKWGLVRSRGPRNPYYKAGGIQELGEELELRRKIRVKSEDWISHRENPA